MNIVSFIIQIDNNEVKETFLEGALITLRPKC